MYDFDFDKGRKKKEKKEKKEKEEEKFCDSKPRHFQRKWPRQKHQRNSGNTVKDRSVLLWGTQSRTVLVCGTNL